MPKALIGVLLAAAAATTPASDQARWLLEGELEKGPTYAQMAGCGENITWERRMEFKATLICDAMPDGRLQRCGMTSDSAPIMGPLLACTSRFYRVKKGVTGRIMFPVTYQLR